MREQMSAIQAACRRLSTEHRIALPSELVQERLSGLAERAGALFSDRVVEITFLLDQCGSLGFNALRRALGPISTRTLSQKLAYLRDEGLVERRLQDGNPPRVAYRLTMRGRTFTELLYPALIHAGASAPSPDGGQGAR